MRARALLFLLVAACIPGLTRAAVFCVFTSTGLQFALDIAEVNGQTDSIHIAAGNYVVPVSSGFVYDSNSVAAGDDKNLFISGGWEPLGGDPCGKAPSTTTAFDTVINGDHRFRGLTVRSGSNGFVGISNLWFLNGDAGTESGGGLLVNAIDPDGLASFIVQNCVFSGNKARLASAMYLFNGHETRVRNSVFRGNHSTLGLVVYVKSQAPGVYFTNNTVIGNTTDGGNAGVLIAAANSTGARYFVANNILWDNAGLDVQLQEGTAGSYFVHNDVQYRLGAAGTEFGNIAVAPQFNSIFIYDLKPAEGSPLINAGTQPPATSPVPTPFDQDWDPGSVDIVGKARVQAGQVDLGAFEASPLFSNGFE